MSADGLLVPLAAMLGDDGAGLDVALAAVLPVFLICSASMSGGLMRLALRDEARHVAFGVAHTAHLAGSDPAYLGVLRQSVERRHAALLNRAAGLNSGVFDALVLLAAGSSKQAAISRGWQAVRGLQDQIDEGHPPAAGLHRLPRRRGRGAVGAAHPQLHVTRTGDAPHLRARHR